MRHVAAAVTLGVKEFDPFDARQKALVIAAGMKVKAKAAPTPRPRVLQRGSGNGSSGPVGEGSIVPSVVMNVAPRLRAGVGLPGL